MAPFNLAIDAFGLILSVRSIFILQRGSPWMSAGWAVAAVYFITLFLHNLKGSATLGAPGEYALVLAVAVVWIVAVVRDEPQAEPWWWPRYRAQTRAEKRQSGPK
jgi:hypothetical protein